MLNRRHTRTQSSSIRHALFTAFEGGPETSESISGRSRSTRCSWNCRDERGLDAKSETNETRGERTRHPRKSARSALLPWAWPLSACACPNTPSTATLLPIFSPFSFSIPDYIYPQSLLISPSPSSVRPSLRPDVLLSVSSHALSIYVDIFNRPRPPPYSPCASSLFSPSFLFSLASPPRATTVDTPSVAPTPSPRPKSSRCFYCGDMVRGTDQ